MQASGAGTHSCVLATSYGPDWRPQVLVPGMRCVARPRTCRSEGVSGDTTNFPIPLSSLRSRNMGFLGHEVRNSRAVREAIRTRVTRYPGLTENLRDLKEVLPDTAALLVRPRVRRRLGKEEWNQIGVMTIATLPEYIPRSSPSVTRKILDVLGVHYRPFHSGRQFDLVLAFQLASRTIDFSDCFSRTHGYLGPEPKQTINFECVDITKGRVALCYREAFGRELEVDPRTYRGKCVAKSDLNAMHDGMILDCPIAPSDFDESKSYSVLVDNTHDAEAVDIRVIYMKALLPFVYIKRRPIQSRFANENRVVTVESLEDHVAPHEQMRLENFCRQFGVDYCELDCVRDAGTNQFYVLDVNPTPAGPPNGLNFTRRLQALEELSYWFARNLLLQGTQG
jgi:hypothetical protein